MFRSAEVHLLSILVVGGVALPAHAQSIGDYSRAQRVAIESAIARNGARTPVSLPSLAAPLPPVTGSPPVGPAVPPPSPVAAAKPVEPAPPDLAVTGVFISASLILAEVVVEGAPFILSKGQRVPGTTWVVARVEAGKVVLTTEPGARAGKPASRTFLLAAEGS